MVNDGDVSPESEARRDEDDWLADVRAALIALLELFDSEPRLARAWQHGHELVRKIRAERESEAPSRKPDESDPELATVEIPAMLLNAKAERARRCVRYLAEQGRQGFTPSNRQIATGIGVAHKEQISKLLSRLEGFGIVSKFSHGAGRPNAWRLTKYGQEIAEHFECRESGQAAVVGGR